MTLSPQKDGQDMVRAVSTTACLSNPRDPNSPMYYLSNGKSNG